MRTKESPEQHLHVMEAHRLKGLDDIYQALDKLGQTPWTINRPVFDIMAVVWNSGKELAGIPVRDPHLNLNIPGLQYDFLDQDVEIDETQESPRLEGEKKEIYRSLLATRRSAYGQRCSVNYQLEIARAVSTSLKYESSREIKLISDMHEFTWTVLERNFLLSPQRRLSWKGLSSPCQLESYW